jgi:GNAT superfamily N-acetyltransferase
MPVREITPADPRGVKSFIRLERELMAAEPLFVPELEGDLKRRLLGRSSFYQGMEHALFTASNSRDVARCVAFVNRRYQEFHDEEVGFIGYFAALPRAQSEVSELLEAAEQWLSARGVTRVIAPYNGTALLGAALLTDGFEGEPMFPFAWHPPYYAGYMDRAGYRPSYPMWHFEIDFASERYRSVSRDAIDGALCRVRPVDKKRWKSELETLLYLFNEGFREEWEFHPYTSAEFREMFEQLKPVLDARQMLIAEVDGEPAGYCFGFPDWNPLFRSFRGRMDPIKLIRFLLGARRYNRAGLVAIAVLPQHRGKRIGHTLASTLYRRYEELGLSGALYYLVNDVNLASRRLAESFGGRGRVLYHCFDKPLDPGRT